MLKIPPYDCDFFIVVRFCWKFALWVTWWCWIHFWSLGISRRTLWFAFVRACVRACVRARRDIWRSAHQIFLKFGTKLHLGETKKNVPSGFLKKILVCPPGGGVGPKTPLFGWKMAFWAYIFENAHQILMIFSQMLDTIALNDLASVLCATKFSYAP